MKYMNALSTRRSNGESWRCADHPTKQIHLTEYEAQKLADLVCKEMGWVKWHVIYTNRKTRCSNARCWPGLHKMKVNTPGERVSTVLHELAHTLGRGHDWVFKATHVKLLGLWETKWKHDFAPVRLGAPLSKQVIVRPEKIITVTKPTKEAPMFKITLTPDMIEKIANEIQDEAIGTKVPVVTIGRKLLDIKLNNIDNILAVERRLKTLGIMVTRRA